MWAAFIFDSENEWKYTKRDKCFDTQEKSVPHNKIQKHTIKVQKTHNNVPKHTIMFQNTQTGNTIKTKWN